MTRFPLMQKLLLAGLLSGGLLLSPASAWAQCETAIGANAALNTLTAAQTTHINNYMTQELNYISKDFKETATSEVMDRYQQFRDRILAALNGYAERLVPDMQEMSKQLSTAETDQTRAIGAIVDARLELDAARDRALQQMQNIRDFQPSGTACVVDTVGPAQTRGYRLARAVSRSLAHDAQRDLGGAEGTAAANGPGAKIAELHEQYEDTFCDPATGDPGCDAPSRLAGRNNDLGGLLWGSRQTLDPDSEDSRLVLEAVTRNVAGPIPPPVLSPSEVASPNGIEEMLHRRAKRARINTIYNSIGQMTGERVGGTEANTHEMRTEAGTAPEDASTNASYREIQEAAARERFTDPKYLFQMVNYPAVIVREQGAVNAMRLMQLNDLYKRMEELIFMEGAILGDQLDERRPR
jgi:hypothetical protein